MNTQYYPEIYDISGQQKAVVRIDSSSPFIPKNVGDRFDDTGWERPNGIGRVVSPEDPIRFLVHSAKHLTEQNPDGQLVKYCLNLEPNKRPSSLM
jgi:hypothetical protein